MKILQKKGENFLITKDKQKPLVIGYSPPYLLSLINPFRKGVVDFVSLSIVGNNRIYIICQRTELKKKLTVEGTEQ